MSSPFKGLLPLRFYYPITRLPDHRILCRSPDHPILMRGLVHELPYRYINDDCFPWLHLFSNLAVDHRPSTIDPKAKWAHGNFPGAQPSTSILPIPRG
jgi:hypothetical protein